MLLLKHLERDDQQEDLPEICKIINYVLVLCCSGQVDAASPYTGFRIFTEDTRTAWDVVRHLRTRVWIKIGMDPHLWPTLEEAIDVASSLSAI